MAEPEITVHKASAWVPVNLDADGTPLSSDGERMVEAAPGEWVHPMVAWLIAQPPPTEAELIAGACLIAELSLAERAAEDSTTGDGNGKAHR